MTLFTAIRATSLVLLVMPGPVRAQTGTLQDLGRTLTAPASPTVIYTAREFITMNDLLWL